MKLPNAENAFADLVKLRDYSLSLTHPEGKNKARVFAAALGLTAADAEWLREQLLAAVLGEECAWGRKTEYGQRYTVDFRLCRNDREAQVRSAWIVRPDEDFPRLVSCYVL
jgi:hypothetical protein